MGKKDGWFPRKVLEASFYVQLRLICYASWFAVRPGSFGPLLVPNPQCAHIHDCEGKSK